MKQDYLVFGNKGVPKSDELKSFAFVVNGISDSKMEWTDSQKAIFSELKRRNYFYDDVNPEVLVFISHFDKNVELLTGNTYQTPSGQILEPTKIKTKENTLFIQFVETVNYETSWRGFSYTATKSLFPEASPTLVRAVLNQ